MDKVVPLLLLALGLGAAHLGIAGLVKLRPDKPEFWLFGLGVRTRFGAVKVLFVALALLFLAYSFHKKGSITQILKTEPTDLQAQYDQLAARMKETEKLIGTYKSQMETLNREKEDCQKIVSRQGLGLADQNDVVGELRSSLDRRQKELADLQGSLTRLREQMGLLQREHEQMSQSYNETKEKVQQLESQVDVLQNEKVSLKAKLEQTLGQNEAEIKRLREENSRLKSLYRDEERRASLLRQGLVLREANDWTLEQEIQRLANLIAAQSDLSSPRQTDISRSLHRISQVLREGTALTKQAKAADSSSPGSKSSQTGQDKTGSPPTTKKNNP